MYFMRLWAEIFPNIRRLTNKNYYYVYYVNFPYISGVLWLRVKYEVVQELFKEELQLCAALRLYLQMFLNISDTNTTTTTNDVSSANSASSVEGNTSRGIVLVCCLLLTTPSGV